MVFFFRPILKTFSSVFSEHARSPLDYPDLQFAVNRSLLD